MALDLNIPKLLTLDEAVQWRNEAKAKGESVVMTNGCFDLLHTGHLFFLSEAAKLGKKLIVALNADVSVKALKGPTRPVQSEEERAYMLGSVDFIDALVIFHEPRLTGELAAIKPDIYTKAGDYTRESLNQEELSVLDAHQVDIQFLPFLKGYSTTSLIEKIAQAAKTF